MQPSLILSARVFSINLTHGVVYVVLRLFVNHMGGSLPPCNELNPHSLDPSKYVTSPSTACHGFQLRPGLFSPKASHHPPDSTMSTSCIELIPCLSFHRTGSPCTSGRSYDVFRQALRCSFLSDCP